MLSYTNKTRLQMKICVCLKVVPDRNKVVFEPEKGSIRRPKKALQSTK